jgi:prepilin-type N-terminal cleavage/methylation domain-containing protein
LTRLQRAWSRLSGEEGYSLIELVVTVAILGTVLAAITTLFVSGSRAELDMNRRFQAQQNARIALSTLRNDIHLAGCANYVSASTELDLYSTQTLSCTSGTTTARWCVATSPSLSTRFALYRTTGQTCTGVSTSGKLMADWLSQATFAWNAPGSGQLPGVSIDLVAATNPQTTATDKYELADTIVLRNGLRG